MRIPDNPQGSAQRHRGGKRLALHVTHFGSALLKFLQHVVGSHVIGYELATGNFRDYGVILANYDSYAAIVVDPVRNYLTSS